MDFLSQAGPPNPASPGKRSWIYETPWGVALYDLWGGLLESRGHARALQVAAPQAGESVPPPATGTGALLAGIARVKGLERCIGLDFSREMLARTQRRLAGLANSHAVLCRGDARSLPFADSSFDVILNCYMLDLLAQGDIRSTLRELQRVLKPSGRLVLLVMARQSRVIQAIWMGLYRHWPDLVGGCRPVPVADFLASGAWRVALSERITQCGFRSDLTLVRRAY
jgi:ubiquinone/menaquinone biosynthesis C-methylase UbiE